MRAKRPSAAKTRMPQLCRRVLAGTSGEANPLNHPSPLETIRSEDDRSDYRKPDGNSTLPCSPLWTGARQAAQSGSQLRISASQKPLEREKRNAQRRRPVFRKAPPSRDAFDFHISHKNHWTAEKKMYRVLTSYGTTARSSCGRQATRALVRPVYQPIQTVGAKKDRTRRHSGPDGSGCSVGASRARDQNLRVSHGGRRQSLSGHCPARADH